jgi:hypothetical protein
MKILEALYEFNDLIVSTEVGKLVRNLIFTAISSEIIAFAYIRFGNAISDKKSFARNFFLISVTTMLVITFIKGSLALSLGLVGALSIIRFRTAIKEPEELAFLFFTIGIGLGYGSGYIKLTLIALFVILLILLIKWLISKKSHDQNLFVSFSTSKSGKFDPEELLNILKKYTSKLKLKRFDESSQHFEATFNASFDDMQQLNDCSSSILDRFPESDITYVEVENY